MTTWPFASLDPVARLRILAAGLPHVAYGECVVQAPFDEVWGLMGDLEGGVPRFEGSVSHVKVVSREARESGEEIELVSRSPLGLSLHFRAQLSPGWCVMTCPLANVGMAATPHESGTLIGHFEHARWFGRLLRPWNQRNIAGDFERIRCILGADPTR